MRAPARSIRRQATSSRTEDPCALTTCNSTAEGVSSSLDLGLYLVRKIAGPEVMEKVRESMEYNGFDKANITDFGEPLKLGATVG